VEVGVVVVVVVEVVVVVDVELGVGGASDVVGGVVVEVDGRGPADTTSRTRVLGGRAPDLGDCLVTVPAGRVL
jgi:hypothetical protein